MELLLRQNDCYPVNKQHVEKRFNNPSLIDSAGKVENKQHLLRYTPHSECKVKTSQHQPVSIQSQRACLYVQPVLKSHTYLVTTCMNKFTDVT